MAGAPLAELIGHVAALAEDAAERPRPCRTLTEAAGRGDVELVRAFLDGGADIGERTLGFASPLDAAASAGHLPVVDLLLERGAPIERPGAMFPLLYFPVRNGHRAVVERLLRAGAPRDPDWSSRQAAEWEDEEDAADAARERHAADRTRDAAEAAAVDLVQEHGARLARAATAGGTPLLVVAAGAGATALVSAMLDAGADPAASGDGGSALVQAAAGAHVDILRLLLERGADACAADAAGLTPLIAAAGAGSLTAVELLLAHGADPRPRDRDRRTAATAACGPGEARMRARLDAAVTAWKGRRARRTP
jgi:ankyrin repeat protein